MSLVSGKCNKTFNYRGFEFVCELGQHHDTMHHGKNLLNNNGWEIIRQLSWSEDKRIKSFHEHIRSPYEESA